MLKEFKEFAMRGNVIDMAVGIIIGAAFGRIVTSLVNDLMMPPIGLLLGNVDFSSLFLSLSGREFQSLAEAQAAGAPTVNYGVFINTVLHFVIVALAVFLLVRAVNRMKSQEQPPVPEATTKQCPYCISTVPLPARRCPYCTSSLEAAPA